MQTLATVLTLIVAIEHFYIMYLEMRCIPSAKGGGTHVRHAVTLDKRLKMAGKTLAAVG